METGAPQDEIDQAIADGQKNPELCLLPHEIIACKVFMRCSTQWKRGEMNGNLIGLDYSGVEQIAKYIGVSLDEKIFTALQVMESAVVTELSERGKSRHSTKR